MSSGLGDRRFCSVSTIVLKDRLDDLAGAAKLRANTTQQGLIKHGGLHSTTGVHGMRAHNSNKTADYHVRHIRLID